MIGIKKLPSVEEITELLKKGITQTEIAQRYGVSRQAVSKILNKNSKEKKKK